MNQPYMQVNYDYKSQIVQMSLEERMTKTSWFAKNEQKENQLKEFVLEEDFKGDISEGFVDIECETPDKHDSIDES
jgi:hypothetical protein